jgi:DNA-binding MarR family transcriptional regulator
MASDDLSELRSEECACMALRDAARAATRLYDRHLQKGGLTSAQFSLLSAVYYMPGIQISKLARHLVVDRTTLTRNLQLLDREELVRLVPGENDKREKSVSLTANGHRVLTRCVPLWKEAQASMVAGIGTIGWERLRRSLGNAVDVAQEKASTTPVGLHGSPTPEPASSRASRSIAARRSRAS